MTTPPEMVPAPEPGSLAEAAWQQEVVGRFGLLPNFFGTASAAPEVIAELWSFAKAAYLDNPLPSLFKERLFIHLSRFCDVRYCIVRHVGFLIGEGRPAGDPAARAETVEQALALLRRPGPDAAELGLLYRRLMARDPAQGIPEPATPAEADLHDALTVLFLTPGQSQSARGAVRRAVGDREFERLMAFLAFVRTAHYWTQTHPELVYEPDMLAHLERHPELAHVLLDSREGDAGGIEAVRQRLAATELALRDQETWLAAQKDAFQAAMDGAPLETSLGILVRTAVGQAADGRRCAFYIADPEGRSLRHVVGMPETYARAVDGLEIPLESLAFGLAVASDRAVTRAVQDDAGWRNWVSLARDHGYRGCWSFPVETASGRLVGSLALYFAAPRDAQPRDHEIAEAMTQAASIIISRHQENEERAHAEAALRESEERLRTVLGGINEAFYALDADWRFLFASQSALDFWGKRTDDLLGRPFLAVFPQAEGSQAYEAHRRVLQTRLPERLEVVSLIVGRWVEVDLAPTPKGGLSVAFRDIEARKQAERRQAFRIRLSDALGLSVDSADMERMAMRVLGEELRADRAFFATIDDSDASWSIRDDYADGLPSRAGRYPMSDFQRGRMPQWQAGRMSSVADSETEPTFGPADRAAYAAFDTRAAIGVPLVKGGRLAALLSVNQTHPRDWTETELALTQEAAERIWAAIERARAEEALRQSERRLREREADLARVQRIGGVGGLDIDVAGGMVSRRSPEYLRLHGLPPDRPHEVHAEWRARIHPDDVDEAERLLIATLAGDARSYESEYRIVRPSDGAVRWIAARADIERDAEGKALRMVGAHIDVTEQKQVQEALRKSEEQLRGFGEASQDVLWIRDAQTMAWTYLTPAFEEIYGVGREEALEGDNFRNWLELIVPEDRHHARDLIARVVGGERVKFEYRVRRPLDGEIRWLRNTDFPIRDEQGRITSVGGIGQDITSIKIAEERLTTSEERLRSAAEVAKFALWDWNVQTGEVTWSDEHYRMQGYAVGDVTPSYEMWVARIHPDDRTATEAAIADARNTRTEYVHEFRSLHPDGALRWLSARGRFFYDKAGTPIRMVGAMLDTTERREWEERQKVLVAELQHRTFNLLGIVRSTADATIRSSASLAEFKPKFRDRIAALARVQRSLSRLGEDERVTFDELIRGELEAVGALQEGDGRVVLDGPAAVALRSSTVQIFAMALHELTTNAVKYGALRQQGARLTVRWWVDAAETGQPWLHMDWRETRVSMPHPGTAPIGTGQGRTLIEVALPYQLRARTTYVLAPEGVHCTIALPVSARAAAEP